MAQYVEKGLQKAEARIEAETGTGTEAG